MQEKEERAMPTYLLLMNATPEGMRKISQVNPRYENFKKELKKSGGRLIGAYALLGGYDYAAVVEVPSEQDLVRLSLRVGHRGASQVHSFRAFPMDEFAKMVKGL
jgi:uncharacterized protein with GYD domain